MHVLCAPPAFILSQDQTLLFFSLLLIQILLCQSSSKFSRYTWSIISKIFPWFPCIICLSKPIFIIYLKSFLIFINQTKVFFSSSLNFFLFLAKKLLKNLLVRYSISFEIFSASVYSLKDFIVYFSMYFSSFLLWNELHYTIPCFVCQYFFWHFLFFYLGKIKN